MMHGSGLVDDFAARFFMRTGGVPFHFLMLRRCLGGRLGLLPGLGRSFRLLFRSCLGGCLDLLMLLGGCGRLASVLGGSGHSRSAKRDTRESCNHHLLDHLVHITPSLSVLLFRRSSSPAYKEIGILTRKT